jgi:hypothetical protein
MRYAHPDRETLLDLLEDPQQYAALLRQTLESYAPADPLQRMLVEDLAQLRWERLRVQRAKEAKRVRRLEALEREQRRRLAEMDLESSNIPQAEVLESGLRRAKDSPAKFRELMQFLEVLDGIVDRGEFTKENRGLLRAIWGKNPTMRGAQIIGLFEDFRQQGPPHQAVESGDAPAEDDTGEDEQEVGGPLEASTPSEAGQDARLQIQDSGLGAEQDGAEERKEEGLYAGLKMALAEEMRDVLEEYQLYLAEHVDRSRAARDACLAPCEDGEWRLLLRWESLVERQMERKIRLLLMAKTKAACSHCKKELSAQRVEEGAKGNFLEGATARTPPLQGGKKAQKRILFEERS